MNQTKICTKCKTEKELTEFSKHKRNKDGLQCECKQCCKEYLSLYRQDNKEDCKKYYQDHKEVILIRIKLYQKRRKKDKAEYDKEYNKTNKERIAKRKKQYTQNNKERIAQHDKCRRQANKEQIAEYYRQYYQINREQFLEYNKQYFQTPQGRAVKKASSQNRRAQKRNNGGKHTGAEILALFDLQSGVCPYCKAKLSKTRNNKYHIDHIVPLSKDGSNDISNIQLLCPKCNLTKHDKIPEEFAAIFGKLF